MNILCVVQQPLELWRLKLEDFCEYGPPWFTTGNVIILVLLVLLVVAVTSLVVVVKRRKKLIY